ncbi:Ig-like domain-containing protein [Bifidobacterium miconis]|uniref:Ig-like domain-containing protein n=1 Tax=Bifidobacterium miconis TaxID=2834435 RepID=UPI001F3DE3F6|nr:Ig-like domain-containing protein [Bifidobacterium miconis]
MDRQEKTGSVCTLLQTLSAVIVVLGMMLASVLVAVPTAQAATTYEIGSSQAPVDKAATIITINGKPYTTGMKVNYGDSVKVQLHWSVPNGTVINEGDQFTYDLPKGITFEKGKTYAIYGDDGVERGSFTVNGSRIVATYTRADTSGGSAGTNIKAYVTVNGTIAESSTGGNNGGKANFEFPGIGDLEVDVNERHGLWAQKNGAISTDDPTVFDFVVEVHSTGSNKNVKLEDTMGNLLTLQPGTLKLYTDANCTQEYTGKWEHADNADLKGFTANIDQMTDGTGALRALQREDQPSGRHRRCQERQGRPRQEQGQVLQRRRHEQEDHRTEHLAERRLVREQKRQSRHRQGRQRQGIHRDHLDDHRERRSRVQRAQRDDDQGRTWRQPQGADRCREGRVHRRELAEA